MLQQHRLEFYQKFRQVKEAIMNYKMDERMKKLIRFVILLCVLALVQARSVWSQVGPDRILTVAVLVNSANPAGYSTSSTTPGEFQRYPERYLEHLQVPYEIFDVALQGP